MDAPRCEWLDPRRLRSLDTIFCLLTDRGEQSYSAALGSASRQAARRIFGDKRMTVDELLSGHYAETAERCRSHGMVLVAQDTTELDYKRHEASKTELGPMAGPKSWGMLSHEALAMTMEGEPLGLLDVRLWSRDPASAGNRHKRHELPLESKESAKWGRTLSNVMDRLPAGTRAVVLSDRESDVFGYLAQPRNEGVELIVRARHPRAVELIDDGGEVSKGRLFEELSCAPVLGYREFETCRAGKTTPERVRLALSAVEVDVLRPSKSPANGCAKRVRYWAVYAREESPADGCKPIEWHLLTTLSARDAEEANRIVEYYSKRWRIETLHKTLKSGIHVEDLQIPDAHSLRNAIAAHYIAACRVMRLTYMARTRPDASATELLSTDEVTVLEAVSGKPVRTAYDAVIQVARLAGYEHYRNAPPPGALRVWTGLQRLADMLIGYRAAIYDTR